jgi:hypothetical protein
MHSFMGREGGASKYSTFFTLYKSEAKPGQVDWISDTTALGENSPREIRCRTGEYSKPSRDGTPALL